MNKVEEVVKQLVRESGTSRNLPISVMIVYDGDAIDSITMPFTLDESVICDATSPAWAYDNESLRFLEVSHSACRMYGYSRDEFLRMTLLDIVLPDEHEALRGPTNLLKRVWRHGTKEGHKVLVEVREFAVEREKCGLTLAFISDVTDRLRLEQDGNDLFRRYQMLSEAANDLLWDWDLRTNKISHNEALVTLYGYDRSHLQEDINWWADVIHPDDYKTSAWSIQEAIREKRQYWSAEYRFRKADGTYVPVLDRGILQVDEDGSPVRMIGSIVDLSTRRAAEDERNQLFRLSVDSMLMVDSSGTITQANAAFYQLVGRDPESGEPINMHEYLAAEDADAFDLAVKSAFEEGTVAHMTTSIVAGDTPAKTVQWGMIANESKTRLFLVGHDITESQAARQELQYALATSQELAIEAQAAHSAQTEFLQNMSHELRTPMNGLLGAAQLLAASANNDKQHKLASILIRSGESLLQILNDILDFSKGESGQISLDRVPMNLPEAVQSAYELFSLPANQKGVELSTSVDPAADLTVIGDPFRLRQVLSNLIGNSIKFTDKGEITISLNAFKKDDGKVEAVFVVADTGIGVSPEMHSKIFDRFYQADSSLTRRHGGTGLGLSITKTLVELMGGTISVSSTVGKGSEFTIRIPFELGKAGSSKVVPLKPVARTIRPGLKVLIAEDVEVNALVLTSWLEDRGFICKTAFTGKQALAFLQFGQFDGVFLDLHMPDLSGYEVIEAIRAKERHRGGKMPVVAVTASVSPEEKERCAAFGFNDYIPKPVLVADLDRVLMDLFAEVR